jgi:recombination protein RecA
VTTTSDVLAQVKKKFGEGIADQGVHLASSHRIATDIFPFDLATGGGFPVGRISIVFGPESSLKTTMALRAIATMQRDHPELKCAFVDVESSFEPTWAAQMGVNTDELIYVLPDYAEQTVDIVDALLTAEDLGLIVIDSLAALITTNEAESSADKAVVGGSGLVIGKLYRKMTLGLSRAKRDGRHPTVICINQIRYKIGVMYGDPEVMPGGQAFKFASALTVRLNGRDMMDKKVHPDLPVAKHVTGIIKKYRVPITSRAFEFDMCSIDDPEAGFEVGRVDDWKTIKPMLQEFNLLEKSSNGWMVLDKEFKNLDEVRAFVDAPDMRAVIRGLIIDRMLN